MWVRDAWYVAAWSREISGEGFLARTIINEPLVLYRTIAGSVVATEDRCCQRFAPLSLGRREGDDPRCIVREQIASETSTTGGVETARAG